MLFHPDRNEFFMQMEACRADDVRADQPRKTPRAGPTLPCAGDAARSDPSPAAGRIMTA